MNKASPFNTDYKIDYASPIAAEEARRQAYEHYRDQARLSQWPALVEALEQEQNRSPTGCLSKKADTLLLAAEKLK